MELTETQSRLFDDIFKKLSAAWETMTIISNSIKQPKKKRELRFCFNEFQNLRWTLFQLLKKEFDYKRLSPYPLDWEKD